MVKISEVAKRIKKLRESLGDNQEQFAARVGVKGPTISAWERGDENYAPGPAAYVNLGKLASYPESLWFWKQAGLDKKNLLQVAQGILEERAARATSSERVAIPREALTGEEKGSPIELPGEFIPNPLSTRCVIVNQQVEGALPRGSIVVLDESLSSQNSADLKPFWEQIVLMRFATPHEAQVGFRPHLPDGLHIGRLRLRNRRLKDLTWEAELAPLTDAFDADPIPVGWWSYRYPPNVNRGPYGLVSVAPEVPQAIQRKMEQRKKDKEEGYGYALIADPEIERALAEAQAKASEKERSIEKRAEEEAKEQAPTKVRLLPGCEILGCVIGWFRPASAKEGEQAAER